MSTENVAIEYRWAEGNYDRLIALVADLVDRKVDVIAAQSTKPPLKARSILFRLHGANASQCARGLTPVRLPPGRARLAMRPAATTI
jgi:hypothetical protein